MQIKKFRYNGVDREVLILQEDEKYIKGFSIEKLDKEDVRDAWRVKTKDIDFSQMTEEQAKEEYQKLKDLHATFRNFKKSQIS